MKYVKLFFISITLAAFLSTLVYRTPVESQSRPGPDVDQVRREKFTHNGSMSLESVAGVVTSADLGSTKTVSATRPNATEAPTGFDNLTNGYIIQGPPYDTINKDNVVALRSFNDNRFIYEEFEDAGDGLGPTYNAQSCRECHQNTVTGGASQVTVQRTGRTVGGQFFESLGGSLIQSRATDPSIVEMVSDADTTRTFRITPSTLGDGFIESISNASLLAIRDAQPVAQRGRAVMVPVFEGDGSARVGRFGWKSQHGSMVSFALDAYLNEMGITTPTLPAENTSSGTFVGYGSEYDYVADPEDEGIDPVAFADFMRATKAPPRGNITADVTTGEQLFNQVGCNVCHIASITTAPAGTIINGGSFTVPPALGDKIIHPYSDFLLHNVGTGDGIPILNTLEYAPTANEMRTPPLWGLRTRNRLMHDGLSFTLNEAIFRHGGQAAPSVAAYSLLAARQKNRLLIFLRSL